MRRWLALIAMSATFSGCLFGNGNGPLLDEDGGSTQNSVDLDAGNGDGANAVTTDGAREVDTDPADVGPDPDPSCGNGVLDEGESCDPMIADVAAGGCPTNIEDCPGDSCSPAMLTGDADDCTAECVAGAQIEACMGGDGCCPDACNSLNDEDCMPVCGNEAQEEGEACDGNCPDSCDDGDVCTTDTMTGDAETCDVECSSTEIVACTNDDGCCPTGCDQANDNDCSATCGDGVVDDMETCDGDCPTTCPDTDGDACTVETLSGDADNCTAECLQTTISQCRPAADGCCPPTCTANNDPDCSATCGNDTIEGSETCDGNCPTTCDDGNECTLDTLSGSPDQCNVLCNSSPITVCTDGDGCCPSGCNETTDDDCMPVCGNGVVESGETCDLDCPASCDDGDTCTADTMTGSDATCDVMCENAAISACTDADGCCPGGCDSSTDSDCAAVCGNNLVEAGETCDPCSPDCDDMDACTIDSSTGDPSACTLECSYTAVTACTSGDGCCPTGCDESTDSDCAPVCGNDVIESGETCDPCDASCDDGDACTIDNSSGDPTTCTLECTYSDVTACTTGDGCCPSGCDSNSDDDCVPVCGNGVVESGEDCDGGVGSAQCSDFAGFTGGTLACTNCAYDTSGCTSVTPTGHFMFRSSATVQGQDVGSVAKADMLCNTRGNGGIKSGYSWVALISDSKLPLAARGRLKWGSDVHNVVGHQLRSDTGWPWSTLINPVRVDEHGNDVGSTKAWTGTDSVGNPSGSDCQDATGTPWRGTSSASGTNTGTAGRAQETKESNGWLDGGGIDPCDSSFFGLYCISAVPQPDIHIFATSAKFDGNLGGLTGADQICEQAGKNGSVTGPLGRDWVAMMSDDTEGIDVIDRVGWDSADFGTRAVHNTNGDTVESDSGTWAWALEKEIGYDEDGTAVNAGDRVWTGSNTDGGAHSSNCSGWTTNNSVFAGLTGHATGTPSDWLGDNLATCNEPVRLLCVSR